MINFEIDTGASLTILPQRMELGLNQNTITTKLSAAKEIKFFGEAVIDFGIPDLRRSVTWTVAFVDNINLNS